MSNQIGFSKFIEKSNDLIKINIKDQIEVYKILRVVEFTSERKCMSVVV